MVRTEQAQKLVLLDDQIEEAQSGVPGDLALWRETTEVVLRHVLGDANPLYTRFRQVKYTPSVYTTSGGEVRRVDAATSGVRQAVAILKAAKREVEIAGGAPSKPEASTNAGTKVFVVHGHDEAIKHEVARFLRDATRNEPVILSEQASAGATIIEKFEAQAADAAYAVILATADAQGRSIKDTVDRPRMRQNVIFELGYFFGSLGRKKVAMLYRPGVEPPSDIAGIAYIELDPAGGWKLQLAKELKNAGIGVDLSGLV
jgi:predicted nucleotide-binding protein